MPSQQSRCGVTHCPCQDGEPCHYEDHGASKAMPRLQRGAKLEVSASSVYLATMAVADDRNDQGTEILGIYSRPELAWAAAIAEGPSTAAVERYEIDKPEAGEVVAWRDWDHKRRDLVTKGPLAAVLGERHDVSPPTGKRP